MSRRIHPFAPGVVIRCRPVRRVSPAQRGLLVILLAASLIAIAAAWPSLKGLLA
ncbi:hypothetical protein G8A07_15640 [Roseateles sp. DAIF2]|uniref:hypothetical protein n=1 Tax=Roseateles sp. DAIF2 TaxID=2714952 RepID=UPI0018A2D068|nr:hypothetical protein [Roseateles sp. DAIF2]QPF74208.1 hypothetical protein G8A07_15640 [Roseateles sp. DAIF2]